METKSDVIEQVSVVPVEGQQGPQKVESPQPTQEIPGNPSVFDKFKQLECTYNKHYLMFLHQVTEIAAPSCQALKEAIIIDDSKGLEGNLLEEFESLSVKQKDQYIRLEQAYSTWFEKVQKDNRTTEGCQAFYDAVCDHHEVVLAKDEQLLTAKGDLFSNMFKAKGLDSPYLYNELSDEADDQGNYPKESIWQAIISLYRLAILIVIYQNTPIVKEIIDIILMSNPDINQGNIFSKIWKNFQSKPSLRRLIMKLLKIKKESFTDIFENLQKVIGTFTDVKMPNQNNIEENAQAAKQQATKTFESILTDLKIVDDIKSESKETLFQALEKQDEPSLKKIRKEHKWPKSKMEDLKKSFKEKCVEKINQANLLGGLGDKMSKMMKCVEDNDEAGMQEILQQAGGSDFNQEELEKMHKEMEEMKDDDVDVDVELKK